MYIMSYRTVKATQRNSISQNQNKKKEKEIKEKEQNK